MDRIKDVLSPSGIKEVRIKLETLLQEMGIEIN
jgi:hypothetical protein